MGVEVGPVNVVGPVDDVGCVGDSRASVILHKCHMYISSQVQCYNLWQILFLHIGIYLVSQVTTSLKDTHVLKRQ